MIATLSLKKIRTVHARAEELARKDEYREQYDLCVSRAVARLATLSECCLPFVKCGGAFVSYKSSEIDEEVKEAERGIEILGGKISGTQKFELEDSGRSLIVIDKIKKTQTKYPRQSGKPLKEPLI